MARIESIRDVTEQQLCTGCGACAYASPERYAMADVPALGVRPVPVPEAPAGDDDDALAVCPGRALEHDFDASDPDLEHDLAPAWGPVYEVWEGYAADREIRRAGSSGGAATALSLYCLESAGMHGVLHISSRKDKPYLNETVLSRSREDLLAATGSRYAPASPCDGLQRIEDAPGPCVFVGKPCDANATQRARKLRPGLDAKLGLVVAFFCAGTPSTRGTLELLEKAGVEDPSTIESLRYRGNGWPGRWTVRFREDGGEVQERSMTYGESWGFLQRYRQWRCYICPDHSGEFADIAVGDPWYRPVEPGEDGKSLIVARTRRGLEVLRAAAEAGYLVLETKDASLLPRSQPNLLGTRGGLWGRLLTLRLAGAPVPRFVRFPMFRFWMSQLTVKQKAQSVYGTFKRVFTKGLRKRVAVEPAEDS